MPDKDKPIGVDASGYDILTEAVKGLLNEFPGLPEGQKVKFEELEDTGGIAFSADSGALVYDETRDICDVIHQKCQYPFYLIYRLHSNKERPKISAQEFLDMIGKWLCKEPVDVNGNAVKLERYPQLTEGREIKRIVRENSYGMDPQDNGVQDWILPGVVQYTNEFEL